MATIDKSLPNIAPNAIPEEAIIETEKKAEVIDTPTGPVEIEMDETGGAEVSFDPTAPITLLVIYFDLIIVFILVTKFFFKIYNC